MPLMLAGAMLGGALWGAIPGLMKTRLGVNETISTLLLNYVGILLVSFVVHGPWKNPDSLGWPATVEFPEGAILPQFFDTRVHMGLIFGIVAAVILHILVTHSRWGLSLQVSRSNPRVGATAGISYEKNVLVVMAIGGLLAGLAGIAEASVIQNRLQDGLATGYGLTGFLVAWLAGQHFLRIIPLSILMGGLMASADSLQLYAQLPKASADILQALLFIIVLAVGGLWYRRSST
jgi:simple sugar transport system permease protein